MIDILYKYTFGYQACLAAHFRDKTFFQNPVSGDFSKALFMDMGLKYFVAQCLWREGKEAAWFSTCQRVNIIFFLIEV